MFSPRGFVVEGSYTASMTDELADIDDLCQRAFRYAMSLTHDRDTAEELVQDAFLAIARANGPWRIEYIIVTVRNRRIDFCRRRQTIKFESLAEREIHCCSRPFDELIDPDLDAALASLRPQERELLYLAAVEGYTASEIAELTERPRGTVLSAIFRAKRKLRSLLTRFDEAQAS